MKSFNRFLRESMEMPPGTIVMLVRVGAFSHRTLYGVSTGKVIFKVNDFHQHGNEFKGTTNHNEILDPYDWRMEVLQQGVMPGDILTSSLQLDGLSSGTEIATTVMHLHHLPEEHYRKIDSLMWIRIGENSKKYNSFHFDMTLKYKRIS